MLHIDKTDTCIDLKITFSWKMKRNNEKLDVVKHFEEEQLYKYNFNQIDLISNMSGKYSKSPYKKKKISSVTETYFAEFQRKKIKKNSE